MSLRHLLVFIDDSRDWRALFALAGDLAVRHGCRLDAAYAPHWSESQLHQRRAAEVGLASGDELAQFDRQVAASLDASCAAVQAELAAFGSRTELSVRWRLLGSPASISLPQEARYADLCIVGHSETREADPTSYSLAEKLLFTTGRPILAVPAAASSGALGRHVAVAWNSSRASARSLGDAIALLRGADQVTIITVNPEDYLARQGAPPLERLVDHLEIHGVRAEFVSLSGVPTGTIGDTLQSKALDLDADMLVAGAFGQPRLWERLLGGATGDLLDRMQLPILMSS